MYNGMANFFSIQGRDSLARWRLLEPGAEDVSGLVRAVGVKPLCAR